MILLTVLYKTLPFSKYMYVPHAPIMPLLTIFVNFKGLKSQGGFYHTFCANLMKIAIKKCLDVRENKANIFNDNSMVIITSHFL